jgi:methylthioribose-1-phosphate isomerase
MRVNKLSTLPKAVRWNSRVLNLLDQRHLPHEERVITCESIEDVFKAIQTLSVRGAPAIGIAAAYGLLVGLFGTRLPVPELNSELAKRGEYLISARPTAVNLAWAVSRMIAVLVEDFGNTELLLDRLEQEAIDIHNEDIRSCHLIGDHGVSLVQQFPNVLTHCNAGSLAVSEMGTALAPIYRAYEKNIPVHVLIDETRPLLQGARLTAYELQTVGVDCTLITDNMAAYMMASGKVDMVLVGADRITANGDVANKIGTLNLAVLCQYYKLPFYVACPISTIDLETPAGLEIEIEQRDVSEVTHIKGARISPEGMAVQNPAFDVTPWQLVTGIITENGIIRPPYLENLSKTAETIGGLTDVS